MGVNKIVDQNNNVLFDCSNITVKPKNVEEGITFIDNKGNPQTGTMVMAVAGGTVSNDDLVRFVDYDGTEVAIYSADYILNNWTIGQALPTPPDHLADNLVFQGWNWDVDELQTFIENHQNNGWPIQIVVGALYRTADNKCYYEVQIPSNSTKVSLCFHGDRTNLSNYKTGTVDWGDGTVEDISTLTFSESGYVHYYQHNYTVSSQFLKTTIVVSNPAFTISSSDVGSPANNTIPKIRNVKLASGGASALFQVRTNYGTTAKYTTPGLLYNEYGLETVSVPNDLLSNWSYIYNGNLTSSTQFTYMEFVNITKLKAVVFPSFLRSASAYSTGEIKINYGYNLRYFSIGYGLTTDIESVRTGSGTIYEHSFMRVPLLKNFSATSFSSPLYIGDVGLQYVVLSSNITTNTVFYIGGSMTSPTDNLTIIIQSDKWTSNNIGGNTIIATNLTFVCDAPINSSMTSTITYPMRYGDYTGMNYKIHITENCTQIDGTFQISNGNRLGRIIYQFDTIPTMSAPNISINATYQSDAAIIKIVSSASNQAALISALGMANYTYLFSTEE